MVILACLLQALTGSPASLAPPEARLPKEEIVAIVGTTTPPFEDVLLRAVIPVPPGTFPRDDGLNPFQIIDSDGQRLATQTEVVSRYPHPDEGADVLELLARVNIPDQASVGDPIFYGVTEAPHPARAIAPIATPSELLEDLPALPLDLANALIRNPQAIEFRARDVFGNLYVHHPLAAQHQRVTKAGSTLVEVRTSGSLLPVATPEATGAALPHLLGLQCYVTTRRAEGFVGLVVRVHNAHAGRDLTVATDDALGDVYFESLELVIPQGFRIEEDFEQPNLGSSYTEGSRVVVPLIAPNGNGSLHVMRWQAQTHRRLSIAPVDPALDQRIALYTDEVGLAFPVRGVAPGTNRELYSWWNAATARYFPNNYRLAQLDHLGPPVVFQDLQDELSEFIQYYRFGTGLGLFPFVSARLGWGHPYGVPYGGATSGNGILIQDGLRTVNVRSLAGYRLASLRHRMHTDRQPHALFEENGDPTSVENWVVDTGSLQYVPFTFYLSPFLHLGDPFGATTSPSFQRDAVALMGLEPSYQAAHFGYQPHDQAHISRYTHSAKILAWLGNDSLAKDDLRMTAEVFHLSYHGYANGSGGAAQTDGFLDHRQGVDANPGNGVRVGRGVGWGLDVASAYYALADTAWRAEKDTWLEEIALLFDEGQNPCTGFIQATTGSSFFGNQYRARQQIEQSILENGLRCLLTSVMERRDPDLEKIVRSALIDSLEAFISPMAWDPNEPSPWTKTALGPFDASLPLWCSADDIPANGIETVHENYQNWPSLALGYELTGDPRFLERSMVQAGGPDLLASLEAAGLENLGNRGALLALAQALAGDD